ncbi:MAG: DUF502 domain-containing protein [Pseudomonadota bacterium]|nr:DUF502 domain-containing protein [Pseudomonadota bacterium]
MIRKYFITGILVWIPILITLFIVRIILNFGDSIFTLLPEAYRPYVVLGFKIPGLGLVVSFILIFLTGLLAANVFGKWVVSRWELLLSQIPLVRSIYYGVKQSLQVIFTTNKAFQDVVLVQYPRLDSWSLAFVTNKKEPEGPFTTPMLTLFVPTTPNPTSGFILLVPEADVHYVNMSVDDAIKFVISIGSVSELRFPEKQIKD